MDKLLALKMFVETVRCGGYSSAARKLGISTSSVTRQVAGLEHELGASLLNRTTRNTSVTVAGQAYFEKAVAILDAIDEADAVVADRGSDAQGRLRISVPVEFGRRIIAPHLGRLLDRHPGLEISVSLSDQVGDLLSEQIDVSVRLGSTVVSEDIVSKRVGAFQRWVVASPEYLARAGTPLTLDDLEQHDCIQFELPSSGRPITWLFNEDGKAREMLTSGGYLCSDDVLAGVTLAKHGAGLFQTYRFIVERELAEGSLVEVLQPFSGRSRPFTLLYPHSRHMPLRLRAFVNFIMDKKQAW